MTVHLPTPHPDELLYGVISRLINRTGWSGRTASHQIFGVPMPCSIDLPGRLDAMSANLGPAMPMTSDEILAKLTLFPFYAAGVSGKVGAEVAAILRSGPGRRVHAKLGMPAQTVKRPLELRFCPVCRDEDMERIGETYWRRAHQLPGVIACTGHPWLLVGTRVPANHAMTGTYLDATESLRGIGAIASPLDARQIEKAHEIASRCATFLDRPLNAAHRPVDTARYQGLARVKGLLGANGGLDHRRIGAEVVAFFGGDLIDAMGLATTPSSSGLYWVKKHFVDFGHAISPVSGVLICMALEAMPDAGVYWGSPIRGGSKPPRNPREGEIASWRAEWRHAVKTAVHPKITTARRDRGYLAGLLCAWDREWYICFNASYRARRTGKVDFRRLDRDVCIALVEAQRELARNEAGPRQSKSAILALAGVHRGRLKDLPRAKAFIERHAETACEHRRRKLRLTADHIIAGGRRPTPSALAERSGLGYEAVTGPDMRDFVRDLCVPAAGSFLCSIKKVFP